MILESSQTYRVYAGKPKTYSKANELSAVCSDALAQLPSDFMYVDAPEWVHRANVVIGETEADFRFPALPSVYPADVEAFVTKHGLNDLLCEARAHLTMTFGILPELSYRIYNDPQDGSKTLLVEVLVADLMAGDEKLTEFCFDWWYDQIGEAGSLIGFRAVKARGL